mmetsp:Transcript_7292/g.16540  ORF Transcript_7292/g.16540 Transcript_7292/m.16540 type:complete len:268 (-) Transcript_7292:553-1356(-)
MLQSIPTSFISSQTSVKSMLGHTRDGFNTLLDQCINHFKRQIYQTPSLGIWSIECQDEAPIFAKAGNWGRVWNCMIKYSGQCVPDWTKTRGLVAFSIQRRVAEGNKARTSRLCNKHSVFIQPLCHKTVKFLSVQRHGWPSLDRITDINDHGVKFLNRALEVLLYVSNNIFNFWMVRHGFSSPFRQVLLGYFNNFRINVHHDNAFDSVISQNFTGRGELSTTSNEDALGGTGSRSTREMRRPKQRWMHQALVIDKLIVLRALCLAIGH